MDVESAARLVRGIVEIGKRTRIAIRARQRRDTEGRERVCRDDPRRDRGGKAFTQERSERKHLPALDIARRPVVQQREARDLLRRLCNRDRLAESGAAREGEGHLELEIQAVAWTANWRAGAPAAAAPAGPAG